MMRINSSVSIPSNSFCRRQRSSKRHNNNIRVPTLIRRWRKLRKGAESAKKMPGVSSIKTYVIQMKNLKLLMENQCIIEENEKLRKKALLLHQENQTLFAQLQLQKKLPQTKSLLKKQEIITQ